MHESLVYTDQRFEDQSRTADDLASIGKKHRQTSLRQLLKYSTTPLASRKTVNALDLPLPEGLRPAKRLSCASDLDAWIGTRTGVFGSVPYPYRHMHWGLMAFAGAVHYTHIDADGFGTWVEVKCGYKLWIIARPKNKSKGSFFDINTFVKDFKLGTKPNTARWSYEAVVLGPGTRL